MFKHDRKADRTSARKEFHGRIIAGLNKSLESVPVHERLGVVLQSVVLSQVDVLVKIEAVEARLMRANVLLIVTIATAAVAFLVGD